MNRSVSSQEDTTSYLDLQSSLVKNEEKEKLLRRMIEQQMELQQLQKRQKSLLAAQQQVSKIDYATTEDLQEKLERLQAVKQRITTLQGLLDDAETTVEADQLPLQKPISEAAGDMLSRKDDFPNASNLVNEQLEDLYVTVTNLLADIDKMNVLNDLVDQPKTSWDIPKPASLQKSTGIQVNSADDAGSPLPHVKLIKGNYSQKVHHNLNQSSNSPNASLVERHYYSSPKVASQHKEASESSFDEVTAIQKPVSELWQEMRRYQLQLAVLQQRRKELSSYLQASEKLASSSGSRNADTSTSTVQDKNQKLDQSSSRQQNNFQSVEGKNIPMTRYFLNGKTSADALTERTTATWGGSTSTSGDDSVGSVEQAEVGNSLLESSKYSAGQLPDFVEVIVCRLWNELDSQNSYLQLLLDDQKALSILLENTLNMQKDRHSTIMYGISPDFLIYQLDNCSAQIMVYRKNIVALHKELQDIQKQYPQVDVSYGLTKAANRRCLLLEDSILSNLEDSNRLSFKRIIPSTQSTPMKHLITDNVNLESADRPKEALSQLYEAFQRTSPITSARKNLKLKAAFTQTITSKAGESQTSKDQEQYVSIIEGPKQFVKKNDSEQSVCKSIGQEKNKDAVLPGKAKVESSKPEVSDLDSNASGYPLFEALRDTIYSEAATLISQNEARPHFLIELFHELQQLNSDYLRQHCLFVIRDLVNGYLIDTPKGVDESRKSSNIEKFSYGINSKSTYTDLISAMKPLYSENTPSDTDDDSESGNVQYSNATKSTSLQYDYALDVSNASILTTPGSSQEYQASGDNNGNPFESDFLGSTVIHLDEAMQRVREMERLKQEKLEQDEEAVKQEKVIKKGNVSFGNIAELDSQKLDETIKGIINEVIPVIRSKSEVCSEEKIKEISLLVANLVANQRLVAPSSNKSPGSKPNRQLQVVLTQCLNKFLGYHLSECGEEVIIDITEVLFNELAYIYMMEDYKSTAKDNSEAEEEASDPDNQSQTTESNDDSTSSISTSEGENKENEATSAIQANEESSSVRGEGVVENENKSVCVDLSVSETKPLTSYGSGEDEEAGSGEEYEEYIKKDDVRTSMQNDKQSCTSDKDGNSAREVAEQKQPNV